MKKYRDHYFLKAKQENYPARSVYKLKEIDARFKVLKKGMKVLDLGAAPGSWTLAAAERIGDEGLVLACDLQSTETHFPNNVIFMQEDVFERSDAFNAKLAELGPFDLVMSDMAPRTTGSKNTDQARSYNLCIEALNIADLYLVDGGNFIIKVFMGPDFEELTKNLRMSFESVKNFKPQSSRSESKEIFQIALSKRKRERERKRKRDA